MELFSFKYIVFFLIIINFLLIAAIAVIITRSKNNNFSEKQLEYHSNISQLITAIVNAIDAKDPYTSGHSLRVAMYSIGIAQNIYKDTNFLKNLYYIGLLHDVGKIGIPREIINKPGKLTDEEYNIMKTHTSIGKEILKDITTIENMPLGAAQHHEQWDGNGYFKISGNNLSLEALIIAAADTYDAMSSDRSYRKALARNEIIEEFKKCSGRQFEPKIASIVINMIEQDQFCKIDVNKILGFEHIYTVNTIGVFENFDFELCKRGGDAKMYLTGGGNYKCKWENTDYVIFRTGKKFDETRTHFKIGNIKIKYNAKYHSKGKLSFLCVSSWFVNPLVPFYIADNWIGSLPPDYVHKGSVIIDGSEYNIYETVRNESYSIKGTQTFKLYISIRKKKRTGGVISVTEHFTALENIGINLGNLFEVALSVVSYNSSGNAEINNYELIIGDTVIGKNS
ncbi:MAG: HD-GYP domain-containing protein [Treponema sp.]|nr:HD-GYP domain-containing protein [Treponema sp.]